MDKSRGKLLKGFTLIEMIVVIAIIGVLFSGMTFAVSLIVRDSNIEAANSSARDALTYVQDWLIDLEVKNIDLAMMVDYTPGLADGYFQIVSSNCISSTTGNVTLLKGNPYTPGATLEAATIATGSVKEEKLLALSRSIPQSFTGKWRVIVNASDYTAILAYWQKGDIATNHVLGNTGHMFPGAQAITGTQMSDQRLQTADSGVFLGVYPHGPISG
jgi:prepilin-type N-terminal cleavage/methylation domain-containing protein